MSFVASAQTVIKLWPDGAPVSNGLSGPEREMEGGRIGNISDPELLVFPAAWLSLCVPAAAIHT